MLHGTQFTQITATDYKHCVLRDSRFAPTEPQVDDSFYVAVLILLFGTFETAPRSCISRY